MPHELIELFDTHWPSQKWKPGLHAMPHWPAVVQTPLPFAVVGQGVHEPPQLCGLVLLTQVPAHSWKPTLHPYSQVPPTPQRAVAFSFGGQSMQDAPHFSRLPWHLQACVARSQKANAGQSVLLLQPTSQSPVTLSHQVPLGQVAPATRQSGGGSTQEPSPQRLGAGQGRLQPPQWVVEPRMSRQPPLQNASPG